MKTIGKALSSCASRIRLVLALCLAGAASARAQTSFTWSGANNSTDNNLSDANNWVGNSTPTAGASVIFGTPATNAPMTQATLDVPFTVSSVTFNDSGWQIVGTQTLTFASGGTVVDNNNGEAGMSISVPIALSGGLTVTNNSSTTGLTLSGSVSGTGPVTINGTGVSFTGVGTYTGGTTISTGANLMIGNGGTPGAMISGNVANSGQLTFNLASTDNLTYSGAISGTGSVSISGLGRIVFAGSNTYSGNTSVSQGTLADGAANSLSASSPVFVASGANLGINFAETIAGLSGSSGGNVTVASGVGLTISAPSVGYEYSGTISGSGSLVKAGANFETLGSANTYSGGTTISGGTLDVDNTSGSATGSGSITIDSGATLLIGNDDAAGSVSGNIVNNGSLEFARTDALLSYGGTISGTGNLLISGSGTVTLSGANTFTGATTVFGGNTLADGASSAYSPSSSAMFVASGGFLDVNFNESVGSLGDSSGSGGTVNIASGAVLSLAGTVGSSFSGTIAGLGSLTVAGTGGSYSETLKGANTFSGGTHINSGTLVLANGSNGSALGTGLVTVASGATLQLGDGFSTGANLTANIANGGNVNFDAPSPGNETYGGVISGNGVVNQSGSGTVTFSASNTYSGGTSVNNGTLILANGPTGSATGTGTVTVTGGSILQIGSGATAGSVMGNITDSAGGAGGVIFNSSAGESYDGVISSFGNVTQEGSGTVTLGGLNTYSGGTYVLAGTLADAAAGSFSPGSIMNLGPGILDVNFNESVPGLADYPGGGGTVSIASGATLTIEGTTGSHSYSGTISGAGALTNSLSSETLAGNNTYTGGTSINGGSIVVANTTGSGTGAGTVTIAGGATLQVGTGGTAGFITGNIVDGGNVFFNHSNNVSFSGSISGTGGVTNSGSATLTLSGANSYSGSTSANSSSGASLADGAPNALSPNSMISLGQSSGLTVNYNETVAGLIGSSASTSVDIVNAGTALTIGNTVNNNPIFSGVISGAGSLVKTGSNTETLSGANTYTGGTTVSGGFIDATNTTGSATGTGTVTIASGASMQIGAFGGGPSGSVSGNIIDNGSLNFNLTTPATYGGNISGTGTLFQLSSSVLTLSGANTYSGFTRVSGGTLADGAAGSLSPNSVVLMNPGSLLNVSFNETIAGLGGSSPNPGLGASVTLATGTTLTFDNTANEAFDGVVSGAGAIIVAAAPGKQVFAGADTYTGGTTIESGGTLQLGSSSNSLNGTVAGPIVDNGTLIYNENGNDVVVSNPISGTGSVQFVGSNSVTITNANTYTGGTTISGGAVLITNTTGSALGTGPVGLSSPSPQTIGSGGVLEGTGSFTGPLTVNSGAVVLPALPTSTGNGGVPTTLTSGSTTFNGGGVFGFVVNDASGSPGTNWSLLSINGSLTINATSSSPFTIGMISLDQSNELGPVFDFSPTSTYSWEIISATGGITGFNSNAFTINLSPGSTGSGSVLNFQNSVGGGHFFVSESGNDLFLNFTPVPEPPTWILLLLGGPMVIAGILYRRRRKAAC